MCRPVNCQQNMQTTATGHLEIPLRKRRRAREEDDGPDLRSHLSRAANYENLPKSIDTHVRLVDLGVEVNK